VSFSRGRRPSIIVGAVVAYLVTLALSARYSRQPAASGA